MGSSLGNTVHYCCVHKGNRTLYSYNSGDRELESLAGLCLENAPPFHAWYFHTMGKRTFGFLWEDGHIFFTIADPSLGNSGILRFLENIRDGFKKVAKSGFQEELVPIIQRLISSFESMSRPPAASMMSERPPTSDGATSTKAPLLGRSSSKRDRKKTKDRVIEIRDSVTENHGDRDVDADCSPQPLGTISLQKSSSLTRVHHQQIARQLWWQQVRIVLVVDTLLVFILFGIWLAICGGFSCVSRR